MEKEISTGYLEKIQQAYFDFFHTQDQVPVLIIHLEDIDFVREPQYYESILALMEKNYVKGIHSINL